MIVRLKGYVGGAAARPIACLGQGHCLGMDHIVLEVTAFADDLAIR